MPRFCPFCTAGRAERVATVAVLAIAFMVSRISALAGLDAGRCVAPLAVIGYTMEYSLPTTSTSTGTAVP